MKLHKFFYFSISVISALPTWQTDDFQEGSGADTNDSSIIDSKHENLNNDSNGNRITNVDSDHDYNYIYSDQMDESNSSDWYHQEPERPRGQENAWSNSSLTNSTTNSTDATHQNWNSNNRQMNGDKFWMQDQSDRINNSSNGDKISNYNSSDNFDMVRTISRQKHSVDDSNQWNLTFNVTELPPSTQNYETDGSNNNSDWLDFHSNHMDSDNNGNKILNVKNSNSNYNYVYHSWNSNDTQAVDFNDYDDGDEDGDQGSGLNHEWSQYQNNDDYWSHQTPQPGSGNKFDMIDDDNQIQDSSNGDRIDNFNSSANVDILHDQARSRKSRSVQLEPLQETEHQKLMHDLTTPPSWVNMTYDPWHLSVQPETSTRHQHLAAKKTKPVENSDNRRKRDADMMSNYNNFNSSIQANNTVIKGMIIKTINSDASEISTPAPICLNCNQTFYNWPSNMTVNNTWTDYNDAYDYEGPADAVNWGGQLSYHPKHEYDSYANYNDPIQGYNSLGMQKLILI